ncbi:hypothetical protein LJC34_07625 [Oscillospiraceae bacterium OttesenSCG-928-G22]|nr:hypothetical protein [Oscillospiraceae bacterium OttesenSCG-928-G22]
MDYTALSELLYPNIRDLPTDAEARYPARALPEGAIVTRVAPSPTGFVHFGNLFPAITSERLAHQSGGVFFLRIEDTDEKREVPGAVEMIIDSFRAFGVAFDEGVAKEGDYGDVIAHKISLADELETLAFVRRLKNLFDLCGRENRKRVRI